MLSIESDSCKTQHRWILALCTNIDLCGGHLHFKWDIKLHYSVNHPTNLRLFWCSIEHFKTPVTNSLRLRCDRFATTKTTTTKMTIADTLKTRSHIACDCDAIVLQEQKQQKKQQKKKQKKKKQNKKKTKKTTTTTKKNNTHTQKT